MSHQGPGTSPEVPGPCRSLIFAPPAPGGKHSTGPVAKSATSLTLPGGPGAHDCPGLSGEPDAWCGQFLSGRSPGWGGFDDEPPKVDFVVVEIAQKHRVIHVRGATLRLQCSRGGGYPACPGREKIKSHRHYRRYVAR